MEHGGWKDIVGYEGIYQVNSEGLIRKPFREYITHNQFGKCKKEGQEIIIKPQISKSGYLVVTLWKNGKRKYKQIHRLVAEAFIPNPNNYPIINHKDENKQNNNVKNLEWCTHKYNINYGSHNEKVSKAYKTSRVLSMRKAAEQCKKPVLQFDTNGNFIKEYSSITEASIAVNKKSPHISDCCKHKIKTCCGYIWEYKEE